MWFPELSNRISQGEDGLGICEIMESTHYEALNITARESMTDCNVVLNEEMFTNNMVLGMIYTISFILLGLGLNKISLKRTLTTMLCLGTTCAVLIQHITNGTLLLGVFCLFIIFCGVSVPLVNATAVELFPTHLRGMAISVAILVGRMGTVSGANSIGFLLDMDCGSTFYGTAVLQLGKRSR